MSSSASSHCLSKQEMQLSGNEIERIAYGYVVPLFLGFGTMGNIVTLMVLLSPPMRSRSRSLCFLAIVDIIFLLLMLPHSLADYKVFAYNYYFRMMYLRSKVHLLALSNWVSAIAIWLVLLICMERLLGVRYPLHVQKYSTTGDRQHAVWTLTFIVTVTGLLTMYTHISYRTVMRVFCNGTQPHAFFIPIDSKTWLRNRPNPNPIWLQRFTHWNTHVHAMLVVFIPTVIIVIANIALLSTLRKRSHVLLTMNASLRSADMLTSQARMENKITYAACAIVTCFTITQAPSALLPTTLGYLAFGGPLWMHNLQILTNCMVVIGKSINFILFCLSSATFRKRLCEVCRQRYGSRYSRKFSLLTAGAGSTRSTTRKTTLSMTLAGKPDCRILPNIQQRPSLDPNGNRLSLPSNKPEARRILLPPRRAVSIDTKD